MSQELASKLLDRNRVGALLRIFASSPEIMDHQIQSSVVAAQKLLSLEVGGKKVFSRIDFLVSNDSRYEDSDHADTTARLREIVDAEFPGQPVRVLDIKQGDIFCMLLNYGVVNQLEDRVPYSFIISHTAHEYITQKNVEAMLSAMQEKARVAGLAIFNLKDLVLKGRVANTFSVWHNKSLMTVGGFDLRAAKPLKEVVCDTVTGICNEYGGAHAGKERKYHIAGCEETIPLIRMIRNFGACISPIIPEDDSVQWGTNEAVDPDGYARHQAKIATQSARQEHFAQLEGVSADFIQKGIMDL